MHVNEAEMLLEFVIWHYRKTAVPMYLETPSKVGMDLCVGYCKSLCQNLKWGKAQRLKQYKNLD